MSYGDDFGDMGERAVPSQTRTRLPEDPAPGAQRPAASPRRSLMTIVGVVIVLIAAIVFANRAGDGDGGGAADPGGVDGEPGAQPTAPTGERPVETATNGIPSGFPRTEQGAESAAANYAVVLGGEGMFSSQTRHAIVDTVYEAAAAAELKPAQDEAYSADFLARLGLDAQGQAPVGMTFVSRTIPVGTSSVSYSPEAATVEVWYMGLIGMAGDGSTDPVRTDWKTWTFALVWSDDDWKIVDDRQVDGPAPVPGDVRASSADEIAEAVDQYGGFTYAR